MTAPTYTATTERLYGLLPAFLRDADSRQGWIMKRWVSAIADRQGEIDLLISRIDYLSGTDDTSDLVDPQTADNRWLDWIGQLLGVRLYPGMSETERRDAVRYASSGFRAGTKAATAAAAKSVLTGTRYAQVHDHSTYTVGDGGEWDVLIVTRSSETADPEGVLRSIIRKRAKAAGVLLWHRAYGTSWGTLEATYPTWAGWEAARTWAVIEETGLTIYQGTIPYGEGNYGEGVYG